MCKKGRSGRFPPWGVKGHHWILHTLCVFHKFLLSAFKNASNHFHLSGVETVKEFPDVIGVDVPREHSRDPIP